MYTDRVSVYELCMKSTENRRLHLRRFYLIYLSEVTVYQVSTFMQDRYLRQINDQAHISQAFSIYCGFPCHE